MVHRRPGPAFEAFFYLFVLFAFCLVGCGGSSGGGGADPAGVLDGVQSWAYQLVFAPSDPDLFFAETGGQFEALKACEYDLLVLDYSVDGNGPPRNGSETSGEFTTGQIGEIKAGGGGKVLLSYLSIGEAENYRFYWQDGVDGRDDWFSSPPTWIGSATEGGADNFHVEYWRSEWRNILWNDVAGPSRGYLNRIIDAGFDGVYFDRVDDYDHWVNHASAPRAAAATDMIELVAWLSAQAKAVRPGFIVFIQNGSELSSADPPENAETLRAAIDGVAAEDTWYLPDGSPQDPTWHTLPVVNQLLTIQSWGDKVLCVDYLDEAAFVPQIDEFRKQALTYGFCPTISTTALGGLPDSGRWPYQ